MDIIDGFKRVRHYTFEPNPSGNGVVCEDLTVAAVLMSESFEYDGLTKKHGEDFPAAKFAGTLHARNTQSGEKIYLFVLHGDAASLFKRQRLFHAGALRPDALQWKNNRSYLMDALADAKGGEAVGRRMIPFKETIHEGKIQGAETVLGMGDGESSGGDSGGGPGGLADTGSHVEGTVGGDRG